MTPPRIIFKLRGILACPIVILSMFIIRDDADPRVTWGVGLGLVVLGFLIRTWAQQHLFYRLKIKKTLTRTGPFAWVRNPIYHGNVILCMGAVAISGQWWLIPVTLVYGLVIYDFVVRHEEAHLLAKYGQPYQDFLDSVSRWLPKRAPSVPLTLVNQHLVKSIIIELHCFLILGPYIVLALI